MNLKKELVRLSDKLDRLGLTKDADIIDLAIKTAIDNGVITIFEEELEADDETLDDNL
jgi:hypothetical protein